LSWHIQAFEHFKGGIENFTLEPLSMSRVRVHDMEEKRIELETQQMTA
jgi:hypothetical protein